MLVRTGLSRTLLGAFPGVVAAGAVAVAGLGTASGAPRPAPHCSLQLAVAAGRGIVLYDLSTRRAARLTAPGATRHDLDPAWSPNGLRLAFERTANASRFLYDADVYIVDADGSHLRRRARYEKDPRWSPNGKRLLMLTTATRTGRDAYPAWAEADGTAPPRQLPFWASSSSWMPDGSIDYVDDRTGLYRYDLGTRRHTRILLGTFFAASWAPDGIRAAVNVGVSDRYEVVDLRNRSVSLRFRGASLAWSSDSRLLAYGVGAGITVRHLAGGAARHTAAPRWPELLAWSPDGKWLAYIATDGVTPAWLYVMREATGRSYRLLRASSFDWRPCPPGRALS